jgi:hypothetical protein
VDGIYLAFDYICLSDFLFAHIVTPPSSLHPLKKLRVAGNSPAKKLSLQFQNAKKLDKKLRLQRKYESYIWYR